MLRDAATGAQRTGQCRIKADDQIQHRALQGNCEVGFEEIHRNAVQLLIAECGYGQRCHRIVDVQLYKPRSHNGVDHDVHNAQHPAHDHQLQRHRHIANAARQRSNSIFNINGRIDLATADITGYARSHGGCDFKECVQDFRCMYYCPPANNDFQHDQRNLLDRKSVVAAVHGNALGGIVQLQNHKKR